MLMFHGECRNCIHYLDKELRTNCNINTLLVSYSKLCVSLHLEFH
uniref:Uncharacterized protein n=1 Tax=Anguilla anguilla TaxID=7936 RepID=A0A0E9R366_ANGAN